MEVVKVSATIVTDDTGASLKLPVLLSEQGVIEPVLDYLLHHQHDRSLSWMNRVVQASMLLIRYMEANSDCFSDPSSLFRNFSQRLYTGTINEDGLDSSELYWLPRSTPTSNTLIGALTGFTDWLSIHQSVSHMNPLHPSDSYSKQLSYAAWFRKNAFDFLGHIQSTSISETANKVRNMKSRRQLNKVGLDAVGFPEKSFQEFFLHGMGGHEDRRCAVRDQLILLLMHGAGIRESEPMHLYVQDVYVDQSDSNNAIVRLYHPEEGKAPDKWKDRDGSSSRATYLKSEFCLLPRNRVQGTLHAGWKGVVVDHAENYMQLHWFPHDFGTLFKSLWDEYMHYLCMIDRSHPFAFVSFHPRFIGKPYTINAFKDSYHRSLRRIGLSPSKAEGLTPHGHRHAYGRRLQMTGIDPVIIRKALHHSSINSQVVYTSPSIKDVSRALSSSSHRLDELSEKGEIIKPVDNWKELLKFGFEDVDPFGLLSGAHPKLIKRQE